MIKTAKTSKIVEVMEDRFSYCFHLLQPITTAFVEAWRHINNTTYAHPHDIYRTRTHTCKSMKSSSMPPHHQKSRIA